MTVGNLRKAIFQHFPQSQLWSGLLETKKTASSDKITKTDFTISNLVSGLSGVSMEHEPCANHALIWKINIIDCDLLSAVRRTPSRSPASRPWRASLCSCQRAPWRWSQLLWPNNAFVGSQHQRVSHTRPNPPSWAEWCGSRSLARTSCPATIWWSLGGARGDSQGLTER